LFSISHNSKTRIKINKKKGTVMMIENGFFPHFEERVKKKERRRKKKCFFSNLFILSIIVCAVVNIDIIDDHFNIANNLIAVVGRFDVRDDFVDAVDCVDVRVDFVDVVRFDVRLYAHDDFVDVVY